MSPAPRSSTPDARALAESLQMLASVGRRHADAAGALNEIVTVVTEISDHDGAALSLLTDDSQAQAAAVAGQFAADLDAAERALGQGPCVDALQGNQIAGSEDVTGDPRWPDLARQLAGTGVRGVIGIPVRVGSDPVGVLNVCRRSSRPWRHEEIDALLAFGGVVEQLFGTALAAREAGVVSRQLQHALDYRITIERAVGFLMATHHLEATAAFDVLRSHSRRHRRKVADVASEVVAGRLELPVPGVGTGSSTP